MKTQSILKQELKRKNLQSKGICQEANRPNDSLVSQVPQHHRKEYYEEIKIRTYRALVEMRRLQYIYR